MRLSLLIITTVLALSSNAQHPFLSSYTATILDEGVFLEWTIIAGNTCNGTQIERAPVDEVFVEIGEIAGICGSVDKAEDFSFLDESPIAGQEIRYRLGLGQAGYSQELLVTYYNTQGQGFALLHDRGNDQLTLIAEPSSNGEQELQIFNAKGGQVLSQSIGSSSTSISLSQLSAGYYTLVVVASGKLMFSSKFVKAN